MIGRLSRNNIVEIVSATISRHQTGGAGQDPVTRKWEWRCTCGAGPRLFPTMRHAADFTRVHWAEAVADALLRAASL